MKKFIIYNGRMMPDTGSYMSDEAKGFVSAFKNFLKRNLPGCTLHGFKPNHYDTSGFITRPDGSIVYVSYSLERLPNGGCMADFSRTDSFGGVLYRTASSLKDYTGGRNHFTSIFSLPDAILELPSKSMRACRNAS